MFASNVHTQTSNKRNYIQWQTQYVNSYNKTEYIDYTLNTFCRYQ